MKDNKQRSLYMGRKAASGRGLRAKLRSQAGETIAETLMALLISALALTMLAGAISTAGKLIARSETVMTNYYAGLTALGDPKKEDLKVSVSDSTGAVHLVGGSDTVSARYALNDAIGNKHVLAYRKK